MAGRKNAWSRYARVKEDGALNSAGSRCGSFRLGSSRELGRGRQVVVGPVQIRPEDPNRRQRDHTVLIVEPAEEAHARLVDGARSAEREFEERIQTGLT